MLNGDILTGFGCVCRPDYCLLLFSVHVIYTILFFAGLAGMLFFSRLNKRMGLPPLVLPLIFGLKCLIAYFFFQNTLFDQPDANAFLWEGEKLYQVAKTSGQDYISLLSGWGETPEMIEEHLSETFHWNQGPQGVFNDNKNIIRVHSLIYFFSWGIPFIHLMVFCLISLIGCSLLYLSFRDRSSWKSGEMFSLFFFLPTIFFFSSAAMKEVFIVLGIGMLTFALCGKHSTIKRIIYLVPALLLMLGFKPYVLVCLLPALFAYGLYRALPRFKLAGSITALLATLVLIVFLFPQQTNKGALYIARKNWDFNNLGRGGVHALTEEGFFCITQEQESCYTLKNNIIYFKENCNALFIEKGNLTLPRDSIARKGTSYALYFKGTGAGSFIETPLLDGTVADLFKTLPNALFNALIRPFPWDPGSWPKVLLFFETLFLIVMIVLAIRNRSVLTVPDRSLILALIIFIVSLAAIIGWVTPVLGAIVRYRLPIHIATLIICFTLLSVNSRSETGSGS